MTELIKIRKNSKSIDAVSAKELYDFLGLERKHWSRWCNTNIDKDDFFVSGVDYEGFTIMANGNETKDYDLSVDMAKELCMLARNEKGKQARQYFIEVEKRARELSQPKLPQSYSEALRELATTVEYNEQLKLEAETNKPKVEFYEAVTGSKDTIDMGSVAKVLNIKGYGRNNLFDFLRDRKILQDNNQPYQKYIDRGYFRLVESKYVKPNGSTHVNIKTVVYQRGLNYIRKQVEKHMANAPC